MFVYIISAKHRTDKPIKIGVAVNVEKRLQELQVGNHCELTILARFKMESRSQAYDMEKHMHKVFSKHSLRGEWFDGSKVNMKRINGFALSTKCKTKI